MEVTLKVNAANRREGPGRLEIRADDPTLTPHAGLALTGELCRRLGLVELIDAELGQVSRAKPVKSRRRGLSPGQYLVSLAETQLQGGDFFADTEQLRADRAGESLRAVAAVPSQATARQYARRFRRSHLHAAERAMARAGERLDCELGREAGEEATLDLDAIEIEVFGNKKQGAAKSRSGALAYQAYVATWAERGRALASELEPGNRARITGAESARMLKRAISRLPAGHGPVNARVDSGFYSTELLGALRREEVRFTVSVPRSTAMWRALEGIPDSAWQEAEGMAGAEVAETTYVPQGWKGEPLPSGDMNANRVWLHAALTAMNIAAMTCDLCPAAGASGQPAPWRDPDREPPARRAAKALRRMLVCVPARVVRSGRRTALRLPDSFRYAETFTATYAAIWALAPP
jgi:Transposase DDE domain group 1